MNEFEKIISEQEKQAEERAQKEANKIPEMTPTPPKEVESVPNFTLVPDKPEDSAQDLKEDFEKIEKSFDNAREAANEDSVASGSNTPGESTPSTGSAMWSTTMVGSSKSSASTPYDSSAAGGFVQDSMAGASSDDASQASISNTPGEGSPHSSSATWSMAMVGSSKASASTPYDSSASGAEVQDYKPSEASVNSSTATSGTAAQASSVNVTSSTAAQVSSTTAPASTPYSSSATSSAASVNSANATSGTAAQASSANASTGTPYDSSATGGAAQVSRPGVPSGGAALASRPSTPSGSAAQVSRPGAPSGSAAQVNRPAAPAPQRPQKPKKEKKYVSFGTLIACMLLTLILSSLLSTFLGRNAVNNYADNRAEREDSKLSQLDLGDATGSELTVSQIVDKTADAVVEITVSGTAQGMWGQMQLVEGAGSGVIIRDDGYIATNYHVIQGASKVQVTLRNGNKYPARIVGSDPSNDVAVVKIDDTGLTTATVGDSSKVKVGDLAVAIGNPLGQLGGTATTGIISALDRTLSVEGTTLTLMQTDAAINGGNSGGGLFNNRGELIGIVESKASAVGVEGLAFALPINTVSVIINDIIESGGDINTHGSGIPAVGVGIKDVSDEESQYYNLQGAGVYILEVSGLNAQQAGFREMDMIVSFNGAEVSTVSEFMTLVRKCEIGETVKVVVNRDGQEIEIETVLEELREEV